MADKKQSTSSGKSETSANPFAQLQDAGLGNLAGMGNAWFETMGDIGAEVMTFMADRIKQDVDTQHKIMHCKSAADLQHIQAEFMQKAMDQYQAETGKLVEMGTKAMTGSATGKKD